MESILWSKDLYKTYTVKNNTQDILRQVNINIRKGEFVSIMGPSGSGKSTLLYTLSGMDVFDSGDVVFSGNSLSTLSEKELPKLRLHKMGFIFQHIHLLKNLGIKDNIILSAFEANNRSKESINQKANELMEKTGIAQLAENNITQVSGGQLQRAAICRALINEPEIIFGDEPTGALDSKSAKEVLDILREINSAGTTLLLVTHDAKVAAQSERVLFMQDGNIIHEETLGSYSSSNNGIRQREEAITKRMLDLGM